LLEAQRGLGLHVGAAPGLGGGPASAASAEQPAEQVAEPLAAPGLAEQVTDVEVSGPAAALGTVGAPEQRPGVVVLLAFGLVGQDVVGLGDLLEPLLGCGVALIGVGVVLSREFAVGLLDLVLRRRLRNPEDL